MGKQYIVIVAAVAIIVVVSLSIFIYREELATMFQPQKNVVSEDIFFVVYLHNKPNTTIYTEVADAFSKAIAVNTSGRVNITFTLKIINYYDLPLNLKNELQNYTLFPVFGLNSTKIQNVSIIPLLFNYRDGVHIVKDDVLKYLYYYWQLLSIGEKLVAETNVEPNISMDYTPLYGKSTARFVLFIYEDLYCPYCAKFYIETLPGIEKLIENGTIALVPKNLIIHSDALELHKYLIATYLEIKNASKIISILTEIYKRVYEYSFEGVGQLPSLDDVKAIVRSFTGLDDINVSRYENITSKAIEEDQMEVPRYVIGGTPGFVLWDREKGYGIVFIGFRSADDIIKIVNSIGG